MSIIPHSLINVIYDFYYTKQLDAFFSWLRTEKHPENGLVFIDLPHLEFYCDYTRNTKSPSQEINFILCSCGGLTKAQHKIIEKRHDDSSWHPLFRSPVFEVWECVQSRVPHERPLRHGLSQEEKESLLIEARRALASYFAPAPHIFTPLKTAHERFNYIADVDVTLWVNGELRGSIIIQNRPLMEAIAQATMDATADERFKPLSKEEVPYTKIEIVLLRTLRIPLQHKEIIKNEIYPEKGYLMRIGGKTGWFLPGVLNIFTFPSLTEFLNTLMKQKIGLTSTPAERSVSVFEVENFIESTTKIPLTLCGPLVNHETPLSDENALERARQMAESGVAYLTRIQQPDGNIPPIIDVLTGRKSQVDWARLAHSVWALILFGRKTKHTESIETAQKGYAYLKQNVFTHARMSAYTRTLALAYFNRAAREMRDSAQDRASMRALEVQAIATFPYEPILFTQVASCFLDHESTHGVYRGVAEKYLLPVLTDFEQKFERAEPIDLAAYVELVPLLRKMAEIKNEPVLIAQSEKIAEWYLALERPDGSFPAFPGSSFSYTRGTGKVFEVFAQHFGFDHAFLSKTISWLEAMQYTRENTYFMEPPMAEKVLGGFRHDATNQAVWIDGVSHVLIGVSRLIV